VGCLCHSGLCVNLPASHAKQNMHPVMLGIKFRITLKCTAGLDQSAAHRVSLFMIHAAQHAPAFWTSRLEHSMHPV
jgi:hypothetical protein